MSGFDLTQTLDGTKTIVLNYLPIGLTSVFLNDNEQYISANCELSPSSNVTYTENNVSIEYKAKRVFIVGNANNSKMNEILGMSMDGQLIIENKNSNGDKILYMCFPLVVTNPGPRSSSIDALIQLATSGTSVTQLTADFQKDITAKVVPDLKYIEYQSSKGNNAKVILYGAPISIISVYLKKLENNLTLFNTQPTEYSILGPVVPGDWMECDYVPLDSDEVSTYNLPVGSGLVQDNAAYNSLRTMLMYILFLIFTGLMYTLIPTIYIYMLKFMFNFTETKTPPAQRSQMGKFDGFMIVFCSILVLLFIVIGSTSDASYAPQLLLYGVVLGILVLLGYIVITSKKSMQENWPIMNIQKDSATKV